jgi:hypothetical protein
VPLPQSGSEADSPTASLPDFEPPPLLCDDPGLVAGAAYAGLPRPSAAVSLSPPRLPAGSTDGTDAGPCVGRSSIPLHSPLATKSIPTVDFAQAIHAILTSINICVLIITMYITTTESSEAHFQQRKKLRRRGEGAVLFSTHHASEVHEEEDEPLQHPHSKQVHDLLLWHVAAMDARWYVKPRSTCWFDEYLFNIYTPDMFFDILRMRRQTFDRLVEDLRPHITGQDTHWRQPIGVEKNVVVTMFKLMHGACIPLVADKAALGKSTVHEILRQVCSAISNHFGHRIAWPTGRRLVRVAAGFQSKQGLPNCIGAIDGTRIYITSPSNTIATADHRNRHKSFSILLQAVVDSKCYFTSINTGPPGSLHDSAHFKSTELYRKAYEGTMGGFHDDPLTWGTGLPFPPYLVADQGYPLLSWCITPIKIGPMGLPLSREEAWFNQKHSSTRMSIERGFGILKARFKEIGTKSSLKLDFMPTVIHACCVLHNILLASKDRTLDQILQDCNLPPMDAHDMTRQDEEEGFHPPRPTGLVSEERALLEGQMAREDILDYLVRTQNATHVGTQTRRHRN